MQHIGVAMSKVLGNLKNKMIIREFFVHDNGCVIPITLKFKLKKEELDLYAKALICLINFKELNLNFKRKF